jgi:hypothetical protein
MILRTYDHSYVCDDLDFIYMLGQLITVSRELFS